MVFSERVLFKVKSRRILNLKAKIVEKSIAKVSGFLEMGTHFLKIYLYLGKKIPLALTPCLKSECALWRDGKCIPDPESGITANSRSIGRTRIFAVNNTLGKYKKRDFITSPNQIRKICDVR
jgi:hypothetical protein